jgi:N6-L-threonylcarbamoyladenine synthase
LEGSRSGDPLKARTVLGIETSCDETAASVVRREVDGSGAILSNIVLSQIADHAAFGGVVPEIAARAHVETLDGVIRAALEEAATDWDGLDALAVTAGPGLIGGLLVGLVSARAIAAARGLPLLPLNHLEGHALTARLTDGVDFPYLLLLVSGGHTQLLAVEGVGRYRRLGSTIDDALGEAFDKTAKLLGLPYPGGPNVERAAAQGDPERFRLPRPLKGVPGCDFSLSGLKTALRLEAEAIAPIDESDVADLCAGFQASAADVVENRTRHALAVFAEQIGRRPDALVVAGGVAANATIRRRLQDLCRESGTRFVAPPAALCTDNAAMIAWAGAERLAAGLHTDPDLPARPRWPLDEAAEPMGGAGKRGAARMSGSLQRVVVAGAGAFGTALALAALRAGRDVTLWARDPVQAQFMRSTRENSAYLPGVAIPPGVQVSSDTSVFRGADMVLLAAPAQATRDLLRGICPDIPGGAAVVACSKGIEHGTAALQTGIIAELLPSISPAALSGPGFAEEIARGLPTAVTIAAGDIGLAEGLSAALSSDAFRPYASDDLVGVELGGAAKNVLAIACGIVAGRALGESARAALIARGLSEMMRLGAALGARPETFMGLSGLGDLVLTATSEQSRNTAFGIALGQGRSAAELLCGGAPLVEGAYSARMAVALAAEHGVETPIMAAVAAVVDGESSVADAIGSLVNRPLRRESDDTYAS